MDPEAPGLLSSIIGSAHKETKNLSRSISKMFRNFLFSVKFMVYTIQFTVESQEFVQTYKNIKYTYNYTFFGLRLSNKNFTTESLLKC